MILTLISFLGTSVGGKLFGMISDWFSERRIHAREEKELEHQRSLADKGQLREYMEAINQPQPEGAKYSPLAYVNAFSIGLFSTFYCYCTVKCFTDNPTAIVFTKDPSEASDSFSILFGTISWDLANNQVVSMSKIGVGLLLLYPVIFILTMVLTGDKLKRK